MQNEPDSPARLIAKLSSKKVAEREEAEGALQALGPQALDMLLPVLCDEAKMREKRNRSLQLAIGSLVGIVILATLVHSIVTHKIPWDMISSNFTTFLCLVGGVTYGVTSVHKNATKWVAQFDDVRCVGAFAEALHYGDAEIRLIAENKLTALLPRMQASDAALLSAPQREILTHALEKEKEPLVLAILKAYEQIGDEDAISKVEKLTRSKKPALREAATACLPYLQQRRDENRLRQSLLRPSSARDSSPEMLLRAAQSGPATSPDQLLRAARSDDRPDVSSAQNPRGDWQPSCEVTPSEEQQTLRT